MSAILQTTGINKQSVVAIEEAIKKAVDNSEDPLVQWTQLKVIESAIKNVREKIRDTVVTAANLHGKKFDHRGVSFEVKEAGTKYDYSGCQDIILDELNTELEKLKEKIKDREDFLKSLKSRYECINEDTGETWTVYPPVKRSTTTVEVRLK